MKKYLWGYLIAALLSSAVSAQNPPITDVAAYQVGVVAETLPGAALNYTITITNHGPTALSSFYILDGWTVNDAGISGFVEPLAEPDFGEFQVLGSWRKQESDQIVLAWLLEGAFAPGATQQFDWQVQVDQAYEGVLINWVSIETEAIPSEISWQARTATTQAAPPTLAALADSNSDNNRTTDGVTIVTTEPTGNGLDLAIYQTGIVTESPLATPLHSTWLVANLGPQSVQQFYVLAGWSLAPNGGSVLVTPAPEPAFGDFAVLGSWRQASPDEERWLWLLAGDLAPGHSALIAWSRPIIPTYQGDFINRAEVLVQPPPGTWAPRLTTNIAPPILPNTADSTPANNRSADALTTLRP
jgi:hypothetical protein